MLAARLKTVVGNFHALLIRASTAASLTYGYAKLFTQLLSRQSRFRNSLSMALFINPKPQFKSIDFSLIPFSYADPETQEVNFQLGNVCDGWLK